MREDDAKMFVAAMVLGHSTRGAGPISSSRAKTMWDEAELLVKEGLDRMPRIAQAIDDAREKDRATRRAQDDARAAPKPEPTGVPR